MRAIIPVAGIGSRLKPHTQTQPKSLIPVAGKPILGHIMDNLVNAGIDDFVCVIGVAFVGHLFHLFFHLIILY